MERLRALVHPDFVLIGTRSTGPFMMHRDEWLDAIQRRDVDTIDLEVHDATALDNVMIGTVQASWRVKYLGRVIEDCVRPHRRLGEGRGPLARDPPPLDAGARGHVRRASRFSRRGEV